MLQKSSLWPTIVPSKKHTESFPQNELDFSFQNIAPYFQNKKTKNKKSCEYLPSIWMGYSKSHAKQTKKEWGLESIKITKLKIKNIKIMRLKKLKVNHMQFWEEWNIVSFNLKRLKIINHKQFPKINTKQKKQNKNMQSCKNYLKSDLNVLKVGFGWT